jgi:hypothetical protein
VEDFFGVYILDINIDGRWRGLTSQDGRQAGAPDSAFQSPGEAAVFAERGDINPLKFFAEWPMRRIMC